MEEADAKLSEPRRLSWAGWDEASVPASALETLSPSFHWQIHPILSNSISQTGCRSEEISSHLFALRPRAVWPR